MTDPTIPDPCAAGTGTSESYALGSLLLHLQSGQTSHPAAWQAADSTAIDDYFSSGMLANPATGDTSGVPGGSFAMDDFETVTTLTVYVA